MATGESLRNKLKEVLKEQERESSKGRRSGDFLKVFKLLHPNNYNDFIRRLTIEEAREMTDEMSKNRFYLKELAKWIDNENLLVLIFAANNCAEFCMQQLTDERFEQIIAFMTAPKVYEIFQWFEWNERVYTIQILEKEKLEQFISYVCLNGTPKEFFALLENDLENDLETRQIVFKAFLELEEKYQAIVLTKVPIGWREEVFELFWKSRGNEMFKILENIPIARMVEILLECNPKVVKGIFEVLSSADYVFSWENIDWKMRIAVMKLLNDFGLEIKELFTIEELVNCYLEADRPAQKFIFYEVLPMFEEEKTLLKFYTLFDNTKTLERMRLLEMLCVEEGDPEQVITIKAELATQMRQVLEEIGGIEIFEKLFLEHFQNNVAK